MLTLFSVLVVPMSFLFLGLYSSTFSMVHTDYLEMNTQLSQTISQQVDTYLYARMNFAFYLSQSRAAQKLAAQVEDSYEDATEIFRQLASSMAAIQSYDNVFSMAAIFPSGEKSAPPTACAQIANCIITTIWLSRAKARKASIKR